MTDGPAPRSDTSGGVGIARKWVMRQYWRLQQSQAVISLGFWSVTLTLLIFPYVAWRFEGEESLAGIPLTYWGLGLIFMGVITSVLLVGYVYDNFLGLWREWRTVDTERNPYSTYALVPWNMMILGFLHEVLTRVADEDDERLHEELSWLRTWMAQTTSEELFARSVQRWDDLLGRATPEFGFLPPSAVSDARKVELTPLDD